MSAPDVRLIVGTTELTDWESFDIESDLLQPADAFSFVKRNIAGAMAGKVQPFDEVKVVIDDDVAMVGYVDDVTYADGQVQIQGRDRFGQLVDCSATPKTYRRQRLDILAQTLAGTWVSTWQVDPTVTLSQHRAVKVEPGEPVIDVLIRIAKKDKVLIWYTAGGNGMIGRPDYRQPVNHFLRREIGSLQQRNNILDGGTVSISGRELYSQIIVLGQSGNSSSTWGRTALMEQSAQRSGLGITRPLIVTDGDLRSRAQASSKAEDEVDRRDFDATVLRYVVQGFYGTSPAGKESRFEIDQRATVADDVAGINGTYLITSRRFTMAPGEGHKTALELHPEVWMT